MSLNVINNILHFTSYSTSCVPKWCIYFKQIVFIISVSLNILTVRFIFDLNTIIKINQYAINIQKVQSLWKKINENILNLNLFQIIQKLWRFPVVRFDGFLLTQNVAIFPLPYKEKIIRYENVYFICLYL